MSLILGTTAAILALRKMKRSSSPGESQYIKGTDVLGEQPKQEAKPSESITIQVRPGSFLTSVAAGITAAGIVTALSYLYAKYRGIPHFLDGAARSQ